MYNYLIYYNFTSSASVPAPRSASSPSPSRDIFVASKSKFLLSNQHLCTCLGGPVFTFQSFPWWSYSQTLLLTKWNQSDPILMTICRCSISLLESCKLRIFLWVIKDYFVWSWGCFGLSFSSSPGLCLIGLRRLKLYSCPQNLNFRWQYSL